MVVTHSIGQERIKEAQDFRSAPSPHLPFETALPVTPGGPAGPGGPSKPCKVMLVGSGLLERQCELLDPLTIDLDLRGTVGATAIPTRDMTPRHRTRPLRFPLFVMR